MAKYDVFISYSRKDTIIADKICNALEDANISYFIDRQGISGGMEFPIVLANAICESKLFLFLASENSYQSKFTLNEVTFAFNKKLKRSILPVIIDQSSLPVELEFIFAGINWLSFMPNTNFIELCNSVKDAIINYNIEIQSFIKKIGEILHKKNDIDLSKQLATQLKENESSLYYFILGIIQEHEGMYEQSYISLTEAVSCENPFAEFYLAYLYYDKHFKDIIPNWNGNMAHINKWQADLFKKSYHHGFIRAAYDYSVWLTSYDNYSLPNVSEAIKALSELAEPSYPNEQLWIAYNHLMGDFSDEDLEYKYDAAEKLAWIYDEGGIEYNFVSDFLPKDLEKSFYYYLLAAQDPERICCMSEVANRYENGIGVSKDINKAIFWYSKLAKLGDTEAVESLQRLRNG